MGDHLVQQTCRSRPARSYSRFTDVWFGNEVVAEAVPDANGVVTMPRVPAGPYKASIEGQWKYVYEDQGNIKVVGDREPSRDILIVPDTTKAP